MSGCDRHIVLLVLDADGVLTDGRITIDEKGNHVRAFDVRDGMGIRLWREAGGKTAVLSSRSCPAVAMRAREMQVDHVLEGHDAKLPALQRLLGDLGLSVSQACFMGDDLLDLAAMQTCGYAIAVADAVPEVRAAACYVTRRAGGRGAVREAVEHLLRRDGRWHGIASRYDSSAGRTA
ncbi:MAG TPA: HAD hydrolase family protein [Phycisphaerae bacterium]|nr:HAD hydrolase family protein [Phycisphaerae bacterium]